MQMRSSRSPICARRTGGTTEEVAAMIGKADRGKPERPRAAARAHRALLDRRRSEEVPWPRPSKRCRAIPDRTEIFVALGRAQAIAGDNNQAMATYKRLAQSAARVTDAAGCDLAELQFAAKDKRRARKPAQGIGPQAGSVEAQRRLVALELDAGAVPSALAIARDVQKQHPKESVGYILEGDIYAKQKAWSEAIAKYRNGLKQVGTARSRDQADRGVARCRQQRRGGQDHRILAQGASGRSSLLAAIWRNRRKRRRISPLHPACTRLCCNQTRTMPRAQQPGLGFAPIEGSEGSRVCRKGEQACARQRGDSRHVERAAARQG